MAESRDVRDEKPGDAAAALNRDGYDAISERWGIQRSSFVGRERAYLEAFLAGFPVPSRILDLGCGTGRPIAEDLLARGHFVTGVDQSIRQLETARKRLPAGTWIESRIETFVSTEPFDGIVCWDALFHIERSWHEPLFRRMAAMMRDGGRLMVTFGGSDNPAFTDTMFGETFFYDSHRPDVELELLRGAGFEFRISEFMDLPTGGRDKGRYAVVGVRHSRAPTDQRQAQNRER